MCCSVSVPKELTRSFRSIARARHALSVLAAYVLEHHDILRVVEGAPQPQRQARLRHLLQQNAAHHRPAPVPAPSQPAACPSARAENENTCLSDHSDMPPLVQLNSRVSRPLAASTGVSSPPPLEQGPAPLPADAPPPSSAPIAAHAPPPPEQGGPLRPQTAPAARILSGSPAS